MPDFAWSPEKCGNIKTAAEKYYYQVLQDYTAIYWIYNKTNKGWTQPDKFTWDGEKL